LIGYEQTDLDERMRALLESNGVHRLPAAAVRGRPAQAAVDALEAVGADAPVVVHFDVDVIDSVDCPLAHFPHFNTGLSFDDALAVLAGLCAAERLAAVTVTEINPDHDPDGDQVRRLVRGLAAALGHTTPGRSR
jgi:arginase